MTRSRALFAVLAALALWPASSRAEAPVSFFPAYKGGWITVTGGARAIFQRDLGPSVRSYGLTLSRHDLLQPAVIVGANYQLDPQWAIRTEAGWSPDGYHYGDGTSLVVQTLTLQFCVDWLPAVPWARVRPYVEAGLGYYISGITEPVNGFDSSTTTGDTGGSLAVGVRVALTPKFGLTVEERYALAFSALGSLGAASVGGNTVSLGVYWRLDKVEGGSVGQ